MGSTSPGPCHQACVTGCHLGFPSPGTVELPAARGEASPEETTPHTADGTQPAPLGNEPARAWDSDIKELSEQEDLQPHNGVPGRKILT